MRKPSMNPDKVREIAQRFMDEQIAKNEAQFKRPSPFHYTLHHVSPPDKNYRPAEWTVLFLATTLSAGPVDGGEAIVSVDDKTGDARFMEHP